MTTYTVTAHTAEGETVWLDIAPNGWLVMCRHRVNLEHGPRMKEVVWAAVMDPHLSDVTVNRTGEEPPNE